LAFEGTQLIEAFYFKMKVIVGDGDFDHSGVMITHTGAAAGRASCPRFRLSAKNLSRRGPDSTPRLELLD
jgi:hypothetical protein